MERWAIREGDYNTQLNILKLKIFLTVIFFPQLWAGRFESRYFSRGYSGDAEKEEALPKGGLASWIWSYGGP